LILRNLLERPPEELLRLQRGPGGQTFTIRVTDAYGNTVTGYRGAIHSSSSDPLAVLPADYTFTATDAGKHTFRVTLKTPGAQWLEVADVANALAAKDGVYCFELPIVT
jgi:hypothetical protein